jgi:hypothetical protein
MIIGEWFMRYAIFSRPTNASTNPNSPERVQIHGELDTEEEAKRVVKEKNESDPKREYFYRAV